MPQVSLKEYAYKITQHIESSNVEEAIAHCRHILAHYPKYLPAYRLLARACLEKGDFAHANHFYQCALSGDPQDADAWMNLALLSDDLGELEQATWLMERAFEVKPGNAQIRAHLRQLYSRRDGMERTRIRLTKGALAQLYAAGGFYRRAIEELESLLQAAGTLPPLHIAYLEVALAESLWHTEGMSPMADKICQSLVEKFPNCLQANLIMGQIRWSAGMEQEARPYVEISRMLDPEGDFAYHMFGDQSPLPQTQALLSYLEYQGPAVRAQQPEVAGPEAKDSSWLDDVGKTPQGPSLAPVAEAASEAPEWLKEWQQGETSAISAVAESEQSLLQEGTQSSEATEKTEPPGWLTDALAEPQTEDKIPDWLQQLSVQEIAESTPDEEKLELPDWLHEISREVDTTATEEVISTPSTAAPEAEELPDWLQELRTAEAPQEVEAELVEEALAEPLEEEELPDWLQELGAEEEEEAAIFEELPAEPAAEEELPDWLQELRTAEAPQEVEAELAEEALAEPLEEEALPDWLQELGAEEEEEAAIVEELPAEPAAEEELPDWLRELRTAEAPQAVEAELAEEALAEPLEEEELPDWLQELGAEEEEEVATVEELPAEPAAEEELPDWLQELRTAEAPEAVEAELAEEALAEPLEEEELPDWLQELGAEEEEEVTIVEELPAEPAAEEELPDWLQELRTAEAPQEVEAELAEEALAEPLEEEELPDWLQELSAEEEQEVTIVEELPAEPAAEEELPDWLQELRTGGKELPVQNVQQVAELAEEGGVPASERTGGLCAVASDKPGWLLELESDIGEQPAASETQAKPLPEAALLVPLIEMPTSVAGMPKWLVELESEISGIQPSPVAEALTDQTVVATPSDMEQASARDEEMVGTTVEQAVSPGTAGPTLQPDQVQETAALERMATETGGVEIEEGIPEWLTELETRIESQALAPATEAELTPEDTADVAALEAQNALEWLPEAEKDTLSQVTVEEMPEWLDQIHAAEEPLRPDNTLEVVAARESPIAEEMDWLHELEHMPELLTEQDEPRPKDQGIDVTSDKELLQVPGIESPPALPVAVELSQVQEAEQESEVDIYPGVLGRDTPEQRLAVARALLRDGRLDESATEYEQLATIPAIATTLIDDLEQATGTYPEHAVLHRVLGDAYMKAGQLQKALTAYKESLNRL